MTQMYVKTPSRSSRLAHRVLERGAVAHPLGEVDGDDLGVALRLEPVPGALEPPLPLEVVRQLAVVDDRDIRERVGPVRVRARDVDVGLGRHADVADRVRALEVEPVLLGDLLAVAEVLDDLERAAEREHLGVGDVLDQSASCFRSPCGLRMTTRKAYSVSPSTS